MTVRAPLTVVGPTLTELPVLEEPLLVPAADSDRQGAVDGRRADVDKIAMAAKAGRRSRTRGRR